MRAFSSSSAFAAILSVNAESFLTRPFSKLHARVSSSSFLAEADLATLDLSAVAELKVTDKGGVEVKLIDRIRALEALCGLLSEEKAEGAGELYRVLAEATGEEGAWDDG